MQISNDRVLNIKFTFGLDYSETKLGQIEIKGKIIIMPKKDELENILKSWKDKQLPEAFKLFIFNFILAKCNIKALQLEDELNLPPHVQLPKLTPKPNEEATKNSQEKTK